MSTDLERQLADAYPPTGIRRPAADGFWERGQQRRRRRRSAGVLAGTGMATLMVAIAATSALTLPGTDVPTPVIAGGDHDVADEERQPPATDTDADEDWSDVAAMLSVDNPEGRDDSHGSVEAYKDAQFHDRERLCAWADTIAEREGTEAVEDIDVWAAAIMELTGEDRARGDSARVAGGWCGYLSEAVEGADEPDDWSDVAELLDPDDHERYDHRNGNVDQRWVERIGDDMDRVCAWADTVAPTIDVRDRFAWRDAVIDLVGDWHPTADAAGSAAYMWCGYSIG
ncbi:MAG: hypothetical protein JJT89_17810 [Nitriliruptoraceae bacterium]|nr:hypothetical protein [Nitriliruptoraceae bacterium]